MNYML